MINDPKLYFIIGILIIIHHYFKHQNDFKDMISKFIQYKDINNHETWALFSFGIGLGALL